MDLSEKIAVTAAVKRSKCRSSGQARPPAHPRLRGRRHEAADGLVGPGHPKVGGSHHLRELHQVRVLRWRQTVAGAHVRSEGEEGGEEKRSSSTDGRRQGRDWFSKERQSGVPTRDEWRKKALGIFALFIWFFYTKLSRFFITEETFWCSLCTSGLKDSLWTWCFFHILGFYTFLTVTMNWLHILTWKHLLDLKPLISKDGTTHTPDLVSSAVSLETQTLQK